MAEADIEPKRDEMETGNGFTMENFMAYIFHLK